MSRRIRTIIGGVVFAMLAFAVGSSLGQRPQPGDDLDLAALGDRKWVADVKRELAERKHDLKKLALERRDAARKGMDWYVKEFLSGRFRLDGTLVGASKRLLEAELAANSTKAERLAALERHWLITKKAEQVAKARHDVGGISAGEYYMAVDMRLEVEIQLLKAKMP